MEGGSQEGVWGRRGTGLIRNTLQYLISPNLYSAAEQNNNSKSVEVQPAAAQETPFNLNQYLIRA